VALPNAHAGHPEADELTWFQSQRALEQDLQYDSTISIDDFPTGEAIAEGTILAENENS
jgi:hypothetical protein